MDYDINDGINYRLNDDANTLKYLYYGKGNKYCGPIYNFHESGLIKSISYPYSKDDKSFIYDINGQLTCFRYCFHNKDSITQNVEITYTYSSLDSSILVKELEDGYRLIQNKDSLDFILPVLKEQYVSNSELLLKLTNDSIQIWASILNSGEEVKLISFGRKTH